MFGFAFQVQYQCRYCFFYLSLLLVMMDIKNHMTLLICGLEYLLR